MSDDFEAGGYLQGNGEKPHGRWAVCSARARSTVGYEPLSGDIGETAFNRIGCNGRWMAGFPVGGGARRS